MNGDTRGLTSVIGIVLLVAITVIIAAVAGLYIFGFGTESAVAPQPAWDASEFYDSNGNLERLEIEHNGGEQVDAGDLTVFIDGEPVDASDIGATDGLQAPESDFPDDEITAGETFVFDFDGTETFEAGTEIWFVWEDPDPDSDETRVIYTYELDRDTV